MTALYNEIDPYAAQWLRNLIAAGHIAPGDVTEKDIRDVKPSDLDGYTQIHFFAGIGVWSHALRLAGWPDNRPVWTGSCPCQPFSAAGRRGGVADERHLWPAFFHLIDQCKPASVFGEQVASKDGLGWFDIVQTDLEDTGYAVGAGDLCVAGFGGPHIRQRLFFGASRMEHPGHNRPQGWIPGRADQERQTIDGSTGRHCAIEWLADTGSELVRRERREGISAAGWQRGGANDRASGSVLFEQPRPTDGFWRAADWLFCRDGKWRPVRPGSFPLANRTGARVGRLRAYGNAISPWPAKAFIESFDDACRGHFQLDAEEDIFS